ncbi:hypothetical protein ACLOJK_003694 [Asimina triloba]
MAPSLYDYLMRKRTTLVRVHQQGHMAPFLGGAIIQKTAPIMSSSNPWYVKSINLSDSRSCKLVKKKLEYLRSLGDHRARYGHVDRHSARLL